MHRPEGPLEGLPEGPLEGPPEGPLEGPPEGPSGGSSGAPRWKPNVTVAAVIEREGRFLLVEEHTAGGLKLNTPAGHLDPGESPADGCAREALEETAYRFTPTSLVGIYMARFRKQADDEDVTYLRFAFAGTLGALEAGRALDTGIVRTLWLSADEIRASTERHRSPLLLRCVEDYLAGRRYPLDLVHVDPSVAGL